jgi:small subunit ribosomal protein S20
VTLANHKDAVKRNNQNIKARLRNRHYRSMMRNRIKAVRAAVESGDIPGAQTAFRDATSIIHRVAGKGIIHRNQAARRISRLNKMVKDLVLGKSPNEGAESAKA